MHVLPNSASLYWPYPQWLTAPLLFASKGTRFSCIYMCCHVLYRLLPYNGNNPRKKMFANWQFFLIHEKTFANGDNPSQVHEYV